MDAGNIADHRDQFPLLRHLHLQHGEAGLFAVEGDTLDQPGETVERFVGLPGGLGRFMRLMRPARLGCLRRL